MGNEVSAEKKGGAVTETVAPSSFSVPPKAGQLPMPSYGAPAGGTGAAPAPGVNSVQVKPNQTDPSVGPPQQSPGPGTQKSENPMSASPDQGKAPPSPYSVPQIASMPSSKLCPVCKTSDLTGTTDSNTCTQCCTTVCSQCGFNPNPHLQELQEWVCLNCQMQRALGMDMDTPRAKSQPQSSSSSPASKPQSQTAPPSPSAAYPPSKAPGSAPTPGMAKAPSQPNLSQPQSLRQDRTWSAGSSPSHQPPPLEQPFGKLFGFGASLLNQASSLLAELDIDTPEPTSVPTAKTPPKQPENKPNAFCPLCRTELNVMAVTELPNFKHCTQCYAQVCNKCGVNPAPHLTEKNEWLCLTCQTRRATSADIGSSPPPGADKSNKSSTQSLSDTGYSSDGIYSSHSEITGIIKEEGVQLTERGNPNQSSIPSPSEITKLESSMRPLLESQTASGQDLGKETCSSADTSDQQRPQTLSISKGEFDSDGSDDLSCKLRHDYVEDSSESGLSPPPNNQKNLKDKTDEESMRKQILEMSADEQKRAEGEGHAKSKKNHRHIGDLGKHLTQQSNSFEEDSKGTNGDDIMGSQGGLRRFKTIELNNTNSYGQDLREPELEMESLTGSPEDRSKGEYSSTLPATTPSYTSGTSPTSVSSLEEDSDSSPSRRQRLEEAKQQRKARHRSHGPLLPTIEDSSEEEELREEEELLREQEKMKDLEQQIRSTARKTKRDKEELRAQRLRERSKTPPSNLSPIEDASPTEELRQAAEMEELQRSSCSEYSPSMDSEAEGFEMSSKLPAFKSAHSPTGKSVPFTKPITVNSSTSPISSPTSSQQQPINRIQSEPTNKSIFDQSSNVVDLRKPPPIIVTDYGMDLTSLASDTRRYSRNTDQFQNRHTAVQPQVMNLITHAHCYGTTSTSTTTSMSQPVVYRDSIQNRADLSQGLGSPVYLSQFRPTKPDPSIPKLEACLEDLGIQQQQLQMQQQKLQQQQQLVEQQLQQHQQNTASFARYNLANQVQPLLLKKDLVVSQTSGGSMQTVVSAIPKVSPLPPQPLTGSMSPNPTLGHDIHGGVPLELKNKSTLMNISMGKPHVMVTQLDEGSSSQGATVTQIVKREELPPPPTPEVLDYMGQIRSESQVACCDVVYQLPFAGSCTGPFNQRGKTATSEPNPTTAPIQAQQQVHPANMPGVAEPYNMPPPGQLPPSMPVTNLSESGLQYYQRTHPGDLAVDWRSMKQAYEAAYLGMGVQYGSYTDLRHQGEVSSPHLPLRRYGSLSNISEDYGYPSRDMTAFQESNLAQYSATTAREISRMCAALNSMDQFGNRYANTPELLQYGAERGGPTGRPGHQQGLPPIRANQLYGLDGRPTAHGQGFTNLLNARHVTLQALYLPAMRTADGMIYSTINTPIASTLPITTQPAPVVNAILRGVYRPYPPDNVTAVPMASLTRLPQINPRVPLSAQGPYRYHTPSHFPRVPPDSIQGSVPLASTSQETIPLEQPTEPGIVVTAEPITALQGVPRPNAETSAIPAQQTPQSQVPLDGTTALPSTHTQVPQAMQQTQLQTQPQGLAKSQDLSFSQTQPQLSAPQLQTLVTRILSDTVLSITSTDKEKEKEDDRLRKQQEHLLQMERERIELEKLRQMRMQEELERGRLELQRHREKEQLLMQREIQELQNIKQQVIEQQQAERETQLVMQREQLAQQKMQLEQIQSLQQQIQQQLEDQKRQKTASIEAAAAAAAAEAAAASAAAAMAATTAQSAVQGVTVGGTPQGLPIICDQSGTVIPEDGQNLQLLPCIDGQMVNALVPSIPIPISASEMFLRNSDDHGSDNVMMKQSSLPHLTVTLEEEPVKRIADSSVQTDDEDDQFMSRHRTSRCIADSCVQTDEEDQGEWDDSRYSKRSELTTEAKTDASKMTSSIAIQTTSDTSCQTEPDKLSIISPAIHITMHETSKVELLHYVSAPERTEKGESLACQTEPEAQSQGVVAPQLSAPTTVSPYTTSLQLVGATPTKIERRKPDPLDMGLQEQNDNHPSPTSPQVLYSPVSPLSPHRILETSFASSEKLNKAHVTPRKKSFSLDSSHSHTHETLPRSIKTVQRSMSDPKPLSPTLEDASNTRCSLHQNQTALSSLMTSLEQQNSRKVKRTLPSTPTQDIPLPIVTPEMPQMHNLSSMPQRVVTHPVQSVTKVGLLNELKAVEQESSKLRKQQAELEEEEKEIDAKLRCLELGITQRKETMVKERERRELEYLRNMGNTQDYILDSELNNIRLAAVATGTFEGNEVLSRPSTAPLSQFNSDLNVASQYPLSSSYVSYPYPQSLSTPSQATTAAYQQIGFQTSQYPTPSEPQPGTFQPQPPQLPSYQTQGVFQTHGCNQSPYETELGLQQSTHQGFQPAGPLPRQTLPYPGQSLSLQPQPDVLSVHQRQTLLTDLEQKLPTNYEIISTPPVSVATSAQETDFSGAYSSPLTNVYRPYCTPDQTLTDCISSPTSGFDTAGLYATNLEQNMPRNYVMIDDISELTKENIESPDMLRTSYGSENGPQGTEYLDGSEEPFGRSTNTTSYHQKGTVDIHGHLSTTGSSGSYYYKDYKYSSHNLGMSSHKLSSKNLAPAVSSKRSKHRKQSMEQISKFSPIEEARDVESDLTSYTVTTSTDGSCTMVSKTGVKKNSYDNQKYSGSRECLNEDDHHYNSGRSRSSGYGRDSVGHRSKSYERDALEQSQRGTYSRSGRPSMHTPNSEEESPLSPVGRPVGMGRISDPHDVRNQYGSSHSLPDVQNHHIRDVPKSHVYKPDDPYLVDDMQCAVSDSEAYHLGQEETDWFEKPREARSDHSRHHGSGGHSSSGKRSHVKHTYHDYDEPPEEYLWSQGEYGHQRQSSHTSSREHRHRGSSSGRHSSSRHSSEDPRSSRSSRSFPKNPSAYSEGRNSSSSSLKRTADLRYTHSGSRDYGDCSHDPASGHHRSFSGQWVERQSTRQQDSPGSRQQQGPRDQTQPPQQGPKKSSTPPITNRRPSTQPPEARQQGQHFSQQPHAQHQQQQQGPGDQVQPPQQAPQKSSTPPFTSRQPGSQQPETWQQAQQSSQQFYSQSQLQQQQYQQGPGNQQQPSQQGPLKSSTPPITGRQPGSLQHRSQQHHSSEDQQQPPHQGLPKSTTPPITSRQPRSQQSLTQQHQGSGDQHHPPQQEPLKSATPPITSRQPRSQQSLTQQHQGSGDQHHPPQQELSKSGTPPITSRQPRSQQSLIQQHQGSGDQHHPPQQEPLKSATPPITSRQPRSQQSLTQQHQGSEDQHHPPQQELSKSGTPPITSRQPRSQQSLTQQHQGSGDQYPPPKSTTPPITSRQPGSQQSLTQQHQGSGDQHQLPQQCPPKSSTPPITSKEPESWQPEVGKQDQQSSQELTQQPEITANETQPTSTDVSTGQQEPSDPTAAQPAAMRGRVANVETGPAASAPTRAVAIGSKAADQPKYPSTGIGSKAAPTPGGTGSTGQMAQQPLDSESVFSKIQGSATEQAGKLGDAVSGLGKKFMSFW
ncbi:protein bassoon isoform X2 [Electrophorus electricus]|uniref:protein bassoon isoform X2 n=1 Tax=Electrophorus electricus TaxID=8005 RepID=UPI0015CFBB1E|nr:protein bassoon isoform X2 [Electrophorus electricus]